MGSWDERSYNELKGCEADYGIQGSIILKYWPYTAFQSIVLFGEALNIVGGHGKVVKQYQRTLDQNNIRANTRNMINDDIDYATSDSVHF